MLIVLIGPPGSGKTLQCQLMVNKFDYKWISVSGLLKKSDDPRIIDAIQTGHLLDDDTVNNIVIKALDYFDENRYSHGIETDALLDGMPRTRQQARVLTNWIKSRNPPLDVRFVLLVVDEQSARRRLENRNRIDDSQVIVSERFQLYSKEIIPIINEWRDSGLIVHEIDATGTPEEVHTNILKIL